MIGLSRGSGTTEDGAMQCGTGHSPRRSLGHLLGRLFYRLLGHFRDLALAAATGAIRSTAGRRSEDALVVADEARRLHGLKRKVGDVLARGISHRCASQNSGAGLTQASNR